MEKQEIPAWLETLWNVNPRLAEAAEKDVVRWQKLETSQDQALNLADVSQQSELLIDFYMKSATQMGARNNLNIAREAVDLYIKGNL